MKKIFIVMTLIAALLFTSYQLMAQPAPGVQSGNDPVPGGPIGGAAPIDNGLLILMALSFGYGAKNHFDKRQKVPG